MTTLNYRNTVIGTANVLSKDKQNANIGALAEGWSISSIERLMGVHRDTPAVSPASTGRAAIIQDYKANQLKPPKKAKVGRPKMPKGEAKGRIVPVRFRNENLKEIARSAKARGQTISEWIRRNTGMGETWTKVREDGKEVILKYYELGPDIAKMTAQVKGEEIEHSVMKSSLKLPLSHEDVESHFQYVTSPLRPVY